MLTISTPVNVNLSNKKYSHICQNSKNKATVLNLIKNKTKKGYFIIFLMVQY